MTRRQWIGGCLAWTCIWLALTPLTLGLTFPLAILSLLAIALPVGHPQRVIVINQPEQPRQLPVVPAGWYQNGGDDRSMLRWWDGAAWTEHTRAAIDS